MINQDTLIFHILPQSQWEKAQLIGFYEPLSLKTEGFIHASILTQILPVANRFYQGQTDLVLLYLDPHKITADVRWEDPIHPQKLEEIRGLEKEKFPHIYGVLNLDAVIKVIPFSCDEQGYFHLTSVRC